MPLTTLLKLSIALAVVVTSTMTIIPLPLVGASTVPKVPGSINIKNLCPYSVYIWDRITDGCQDQGVNTICKSDGGEPYVVAKPVPVSGMPTKMVINAYTEFLSASANWENLPRAIKISRDGDMSADPKAHLELSYGLSYADKFRWALTSIGPAFRDENIKVTPSGAGAGQGDCKTVACPKNDPKCNDGDRYSPRLHMCEPQPTINVDLCQDEVDFKANRVT
ncbi:hypothetical protein ONS95_000797 [Cadophora gregata]|uniref:uncharacterized protein n=1 Tax=Cadophora gregata TaxID=51156 RepID=UPI0026DB6D67|nr:uncharacterized protein ONS95_000797 [Cadophora gregata]KAK0103019.1 hypothetical protein ONS96_005632 [Cadophora gregata f. sp. sojae]KAK0128849.1 hypothetical protein ONS95_000797 [Cadophora gregata]